MFVGLGVAIVATVVMALVVGVLFEIAGADSDSHGFQFAATFAGDVALVLAAVFLTADLGRPTWATFGFRRFRPSAIGWVFAAFVAYLILAAIYTQLVNPPQEDLPEQLGADESVLLAVLTGVFVIVIAPFVEEFFFRGSSTRGCEQLGRAARGARQRGDLQLDPPDAGQVRPAGDPRRRARVAAGEDGLAVAVHHAARAEQLDRVCSDSLSARAACAPQALAA